MEGEVSSTTEVMEDSFGRYRKSVGDREVIEPIRRFTLTNGNKMKVQVITYGATITSIQTPDRYGNVDDVVLGFDTINEYHGQNNPYFGATIGRWANRISNARFTLGETEYFLFRNHGLHHLHGGARGFDKMVWNSHVEGDRVTFSYLSLDGEQGYPGEVLTHVSYELNNDNELNIRYKATATRLTPVNLTNHSYFNLGGHASGPEGLYQHNICINANNYTPVDDAIIPTGQIASVGGTPFDFRVRRVIGDAIKQHPAGFDHNLEVSRGGAPAGWRMFVARVAHPGSGRVMEVYSTQPCVQFYTSNFLPEEGFTGRGGAIYRKQGAFCLETQHYPDAVNQPTFPQSLITPGVLYEHSTVYRFLTSKDQ